jgi:hypothetical protein
VIPADSLKPVGGRNPDPELKLVIKMAVRLFQLLLKLHVLCPLIMASTSRSVVVLRHYLRNI